MSVASVAGLCLGALVSLNLWLGVSPDRVLLQPQKDIAPDLETLKQRIGAILERNNIAGAGIVLASREGPLWVAGIGMADPASGRPVGADTPFRLGSVTKNFTALAFSSLVEQGTLSLDSRLAEVAPEVPFSNPWEAVNPVTLGQLLEHTASFDFVRFNDDMETRAQPRPLLDVLAVNPNARTSRWPPGSRMAYSNEGYEAAGYVMEKVTGRSYDELVHSLIFSPLEMRSSAMRLTPVLATALAQGYVGSRPVPYVEDMQRPAANLIASTEDMSHYLVMWLNRGQWNGHRVLSPASIARMEVRRTLPYPGPEEQYGLGTDTTQFNGFVAHGHTGITDGFVASFRYFPREGKGWVVMLNQSLTGSVPAELEAELANFLLREETPPASPETTPPLEQMAQFVGSYRDAAPGQAISAALNDIFSNVEVELRGNQLWVRQNGAGGLQSLLGTNQWQPLHATEPGAFRHADEAVSSFYFTITNDGRAILVTPQGYFERIPSWLATGRRVLLLAGLGVLLSSLLLVPFSLLLVNRTIANGTSFLPLGMALMPVIAWLVLRYSTGAGLAEISPSSVALLIVSIAFPLLAVLSIVTIAFSPPQQMSPLLRGYLLIVDLSGCGLAAFAARAGWLALRTWAW